VRNSDYLANISFSANNIKYSSQADLWSIGVIAYMRKSCANVAVAYNIPTILTCYAIASHLLSPQYFLQPSPFITSVGAS
jgi:hypothetical protein